MSSSFQTSFFRESTDELTTQILKKHASLGGKSALLVGISGIDASGKGTLAAELKLQLAKSGMHVAKLSVDDWLHPFSAGQIQIGDAFDFYKKGFRYTELFQQLILPLKNKQSVRLQSFKTHLISGRGYPYTWHFVNTNIILLEGIFLFRKNLRDYFDYKIWVDCSYETALSRALKRNQEGLSVDQLKKNYASIYFPAQEIHFAQDRPKSQVDTLIQNDTRTQKILTPHYQIVHDYAFAE